MGGGNQEAVKQLQTLMENVDDEQLKNTFQIMHQGYQTETLIRFLKARDWNIAKAHKMLIDCLNWRVENEIDNVLRVSSLILQLLTTLLCYISFF
ncbi:hypothetical protein GYH30_023197 [Glycine max]|nr:hypothetical protein GYH30_023197 [Glycine max]